MESHFSPTAHWYCFCSMTQNKARWMVGQLKVKKREELPWLMAFLCSTDNNKPTLPRPASTKFHSSFMNETRRCSIFRTFFSSSSSPFLSFIQKELGEHIINVAWFMIISVLIHIVIKKSINLGQTAFISGEKQNFWADRFGPFAMHWGGAGSGSGH